MWLCNPLDTCIKKQYDINENSRKEDAYVHTNAND